MAKLRVHNIESGPASSDVALGISGDTVAVSSDSLKLNTWKDSGANTLFVSDGSGTLSSVNSTFSGNGPKLILSQTFTGQSSIAFTSGIDSTYDKYMFVFVRISCSGEGANLTINFSSDGGSNYNMDKTTTYFEAYHQEADNGAGLVYVTSHDLVQSSAYQRIATDLCDSADHSATGEVDLFSPSSTTYVKNFYSTALWIGGNEASNVNRASNGFVSGYVNSTLAINAVDFKPDAGTFDGTIKMYGVG